MVSELTLSAWYNTVCLKSTRSLCDVDFVCRCVRLCFFSVFGCRWNPTKEIHQRQRLINTQHTVIWKRRTFLYTPRRIRVCGWCWLFYYSQFIPFVLFPFSVLNRSWEQGSDSVCSVSPLPLPLARRLNKLAQLVNIIRIIHMFVLASHHYAASENMTGIIRV